MKHITNNGRIEREFEVDDLVYLISRLVWNLEKKKHYVESQVLWSIQN